MTQLPLSVYRAHLNDVCNEAIALIDLYKNNPDNGDQWHQVKPWMQQVIELLSNDFIGPESVETFIDGCAPEEVISPEGCLWQRLRALGRVIDEKRRTLALHEHLHYSQAFSQQCCGGGCGCRRSDSSQ